MVRSPMLEVKSGVLIERGMKKSRSGALCSRLRRNLRRSCGVIQGMEMDPATQLWPDQGFGGNAAHLSIYLSLSLVPLA